MRGYDVFHVKQKLGENAMSNGNAGGSLRPFYIILGVVAALGLGAVGYSVVSGSLGSAVAEPVDLEGTEDMQLLMEMAVPVSVGDEDAPATIIIFQDYLCNHCAAFSLQVKPMLEEAFIEKGQARLVYYDFPLNPAAGSFLAARAARCAGDQGRFWDFHRVLMRNQLAWGREGNKVSVFGDYAGELGMDVGDFRGCLNSDRHAEEVSANLRLAQALGLPGTPVVLVGTGGGTSQRLKDYSFQTIEAALESILGG